MQIVYAQPQLPVMSTFDMLPETMFLYTFPGETVQDQWVALDGSNQPIGPVDAFGEQLTIACMRLRGARVERISRDLLG